MRNPAPRSRTLLALAMPLIALGAQSLFWPWIRPLSWLLFYPAVLTSAWLGGLLTGLYATLLSTALGYAFFVPHAQGLHAEGSLISTITFCIMGILFSLSQEQLYRIQVRTASDLKQSKTHLQLLIDHAPASMAMFDREMRYLAVSHRWMEDFALGDQNLIGRSHYEVFPDIPERWKAIHRRALAGETLTADRDAFVRSDGRTYWLKWRVMPWRDAIGGIGGLVFFSEDISEQVRSQEALQESEARLQVFIDHAPAAMAMFDREMRYLAVSRRWLEDFGLAGCDIRGKCHYDIFPEIPERWREIHRRGQAGETLRAERDPFVRADGHTQWLKWEVLPWRAPGEPIGGIVFFSEDITEHVLIQDTLQESEQRYRSIFQDNQSVMLILDPADGRIVDANPAAAAFYGWTVDQLRTMRIFQINTLPPEDASLAMARSIEGVQRRFVFRHRRADGSVRDVEAFSGPLPLLGRTLVCTVVHDVTERMEAERALKESQEKLSAALESIQDAVCITDGTGQVMEYNSAFPAFHRFTSAEECSHALADYPLRFLVTELDGTPVPLESWPVPRAIRGEVATNALYRLTRTDLGVSWIGSYSYAPIHNSRGEVESAVVVGRDVSESFRLSAEIQRMNQTLEHRVRERTAELETANEELSSFAYAVSHDLRAPLRAMIGFSQALREDLGPRLQGTEQVYLEQVVQASQRMSDLIDGILLLSRLSRSELNRQWVDLSTIAGSLREGLEIAEPGRSVTWEIQPGLRAWGDPKLLTDVLRNLLGNAWKYTGRAPGARITLKGDDQTFTVADNGAGFDMTYATKLFQIFQRLHRQDEFPGLGIGLATVQRIINRHGGRIKAQAAPGRGAAFTVTLPRPQEARPCT
nr:PAS domain S-box protein [uncultured Holophaga sp.]